MVAHRPGGNFLEHDAQVCKVMWSSYKFERASASGITLVLQR
ncbi:uncharacterized protein BCN122_II2763 [Burkholderia cenocepacia]|nr:uncharacterized protein BCN122_II2763 [Burkholderia cenocepacia]